MSLPSYEQRLQQILDEAQSIAARSGVPYCSGHLLLAMLAVDSLARPLLVDRGLTTSLIVEQMGLMAEADPEPLDMQTQIRDRCRRMGQSCGSEEVGTLHLLLVLCTIKDSLAYRIMAAGDIDLTGLRTVSLALVTGGPKHKEPPSPSLAPAPPESDEEAADSRVTEETDAAAPSPPQQEGGPGEEDPVIMASSLPADGLLTSLPRSRVQQQEMAGWDPRVTRGQRKPSGSDQEPQGDGPPEELELSEEQFPMLSGLGRNLSVAAFAGEIEPLVGRRDLVERILDILGKRRSNNPCLVGEPGVGKTAIIEGLAYLQVKQPDKVPFLKDRVLVDLNIGSLLSGTALRGSFSERMAGLREEIEEAEGRVIVFLDDIHNLVGAGAVGDGALDAVGELSAAMARGRFSSIGATSTDNFKKYIEETPALKRCLQPVLVAEPTLEEARQILEGVMPAYAAHHKVEFIPEAHDAAVRLSSRYIADRFLPDKAISLLDLAGSRARRRSLEQVGRTEVAELVAEGTGIPVDRLLMTDTERFLHMEDFVHQRVIGHRQMVRKVCSVIRRNYAGFASNRPIGSFLFLGPTGVGKTETVKVLADFLFQSREALCRFDMSEFQEPHSVARLIGSPPGYVGHDQGGQLTESVRKRPYQIVLLDEVEKAHRDVLQILLQLLDDGRLTDGRGRTVDFSNTVVVMTSNLGSGHYDRRRGPIGFGPDTSRDDGEDPDWPRVVEEVLKTARKAFPIELWNRIEERLVFRPLTRPQILEVARLLVKESSERLAEEKEISFEATDAALQYLIGHGGFDPLLGARPMRTTIQRLVEAPVAEQILLREVAAGDHIRVDCVDDKLVVQRLEREGSEGPRDKAKE